MLTDGKTTGVHRLTFEVITMLSCEQLHDLAPVLHSLTCKRMFAMLTRVTEQPRTPSVELTWAACT